MNEKVQATRMLLSRGEGEVKLNAETDLNIWEKANYWREEWQGAVGYIIYLDNGSVIQGHTADYAAGTFAESVVSYLQDLRYELSSDDPLALAIDEDAIDYMGQRWHEVCASEVLAH